MAHAHIISIDNEKLVSGLIAEFFGEGGFGRDCQWAARQKGHDHCNDGEFEKCHFEEDLCWVV